MNAKNKIVILIGAGNIGSRHLQGLKLVEFPLNIFIYDPSESSLKTASERYKAVNSEIKHTTLFTNSLNDFPKQSDLAIIATSSNYRKQALDDLLKNNKIKYLILEKLLFNKKGDYKKTEMILEKNKIKAWVNCSMRTTPFYFNLKKLIGKNISLSVTGSKFGLATNAIHYIDYLAFLSGSYDYSVNTELLDKDFFESKRKGFLDINGTLEVKFKDGSHGTFSCYPEGEAPILVEVKSTKGLGIANEISREGYILNSENGKLEKSEDALPFQSQMTNIVVEEILTTGKSRLTEYKNSSKLHLTLLEAFSKHLKKSGKKYDYYPFT